jgi:hypothetical protein
MDLARGVFSLLACCTPFVFVIQVAVLIAALIVAEHARQRLWIPWLIVLVSGVILWSASVLVFLICLAALML